MHSWWAWFGFNLFVFVMLMLDLWVFHKKPHKDTIKEALLWTGFWVALALGFNVGVYVVLGKNPAIEFFTGYLIEKSLSVDNIFVFLLIFKYFKTPPEYQHKVLFWGILGALIMRAIFIFAGVALLARFEWMIYVFGVFLLYTGIKLFFEKNKEIHPEKNPVIKLFRRLIPISKDYHQDHFFIKEAGKRMATPMLLVLLFIEITDVVFAVDSIPAIFSVTRDQFIIYTSNVFAILGLRALYLALAGIMRLCHYLHYGLAVILSFVGLKMLLAHTSWHFSTELSLGVIFGALTLSILASLLFPQKNQQDDKDAL